MTLRQFLFIMFVATVLCWMSFGMVVVNIDPFQGSTVGFLFFYASLFAALVGTISLKSFFFYRVFSKQDLPMFRLVKKSFRNGVFFALVLIGLLFLQMQQYLTIWNFTLCLIVVALIISFAVSAKPSLRSP